MFKVYKYKSISVFLLTFFMLTNGFSSFKKEEEYADEGFFSSSQENCSQENIDEMESLLEINRLQRRTLSSFGFFNLHNEIIKSSDDSASINESINAENEENKINTQTNLGDDFFKEKQKKQHPILLEVAYSSSPLIQSENTNNIRNQNNIISDKSLEKNNSHRKRKISIEETNKVQEEQIEEEKNKKNTKWTPKMKNRLLELKAQKDPVTNKNYIHAKIAEIMNQEFSPCTFNERTIGARWQIIGKEEIKKKIKWTPEMINHLKDLKNEKILMPSIVKMMKKKFPRMKFTEASVICKWNKIRESEN